MDIIFIEELQVTRIHCFTYHNSVIRVIKLVSQQSGDSYLKVSILKFNSRGETRRFNLLPMLEEQFDNVFNFVDENF